MLSSSPACVTVMEDVCRRVDSQGGVALFVDYGEDATFANSLTVSWGLFWYCCYILVQGVKDHKFVDVLSEPGLVDVSASVDFRLMRATAERMNNQGVLRSMQLLLRHQHVSAVSKPGSLRALPLVTQRELLRELGMGPRLDNALPECKSQDERDHLHRTFHRLCGEGAHEMGKVYKAFCIAPSDVGVIAGFPLVKT